MAKKKPTKENKHMAKVVKTSLLHQEGHHAKHSAAKTGHSSAGSHRGAHHK